jgi:lipopolysaccharide/colanic/teichoic acid biosynthesis glycosyltransferase
VRKVPVLAESFREHFSAKGDRRLHVVEELPQDIDLSWLLRKPRRDVVVDERSLGIFSRVAIRAADIVLAAAALLVLSPLLALIALAIRLESPGPVIYRQVRTGINRRRGDRRQDERRVFLDRRRGDRRQQEAPGRPFVIYKFRSMVIDAECQGVQTTQPGDARITRVGRLLRRARLDEIPQFVNVIKGDMSIVGPRPERPEIIEYLEEHIPGYARRLGLRPGITGLAQVCNGYDTDLRHMRRKVALDRHFIQVCSLGNYFKILLRTVRVVIRGEGAI